MASDNDKSKTIRIDDYEGAFKPAVREVDSKTIALKSTNSGFDDILTRAKKEAGDFTADGSPSPVYTKLITDFESWGKKITDCINAVVDSSGNCNASADSWGEKQMGVQTRTAEAIKKI